MASVTCGLTAEDRDQLWNPHARFEYGTNFEVVVYWGLGGLTSDGYRLEGRKGL